MSECRPADGGMGQARRVEVWIFNHYASAPDKPTGTRHYDLARQLTGSGHRVTIFAAGFGHATNREERLTGRAVYRTDRFDGVRFVWVRTIPHRGNTWRRAANMLSYAAVVSVVQLRFRPPDVVIGSTVHPFAALAAYLIACWRRARFFFEIRDLWPQTLIDMGEMGESAPAARVLRLIERVLAERSDAVIALLPGISRYLSERRILARRVCYVPNGYDLGTTLTSTGLPADLQSVLRRWHAEGAFVAAYVGAHGRANGLGTLLEAAWLLRDDDEPVRILLVGDGPEKATLVAAAQARGVNAIHFADALPKSAVQDLLRHADAAIFHLASNPVFRYGISPNKLFDYFASERPVIFACESTPDPVRRAGAGMSIAPDDPAALATAIRALARTPVADRQAMGESGRRYVAQHHDTAALGTRLARLLALPAPSDLSASWKPLSDRP